MTKRVKYGSLSVLSMSILEIFALEASVPDIPNEPDWMDDDEWGEGPKEDWRDNGEEDDEDE